MKVSSLDIWTIALAVVSLSHVVKAAILCIESEWYIQWYRKSTEETNKGFCRSEVSKRRIPIRVNFFFGVTLACVATFLYIF